MTVNTAGLQYSSAYNYDQVIFSWTGILSATLNGGIAQINSGINQYGLPLGIYSLDGGVTWNDMGTPYPLSLNVNKSSMSISVDSTGIVYLQLTNPAGGSSPFIANIQFVLLATDTPSSLPVSVVPTTNPTSYNFSNAGSYRLIVKSNTQVLSGTVQYTLAHGQNSIPVVQNWALANNQYTLYGVTVDSRWNSSIPMEYYIIAYDTNNIYFGANTILVSATPYMRIYQQ